MKNNKVKTVFRTILIAIAAAVVGLNLYMINASRLAGDAVPMPFGVGAAVVLSGSMEPEFSAGDLLFVKQSDNYKVDDVVVFQDGRIAVTHRIISMTENEVITKGDANNVEDDPITLDRIKGKVVLVIPFVGHLVNAIKTPAGTIVILALAIFLLERSFHAERRRDNEELDAIRAEIEKLKSGQ